MKAFVHQYYTISVLPSIEQGILPHLGKWTERELLQPDYRTIISAAHLRRMSKVIRLGTAAALHVAADNAIQGIIVGTGLGCFENSVIFAEEYLSRSEGALSPTAFIQSTDNTIAGQIALILQNNAYNITYSHKGIAFENALTDAILLCHETKENILVGGVDERMELFGIDAISTVGNGQWLGEGASFFRLSAEEKNALSQIELCTIIPLEDSNLAYSLDKALLNSKLPKPDLILYGNSFLNQISQFQHSDITTLNYSEICGVYNSNSSFGIQLATEILSRPEIASSKGIIAKTILVANNFNDTDLGLTYLVAVNN